MRGFGEVLAKGSVLFLGYKKVYVSGSYLILANMRLYHLMIMLDAFEITYQK